MVHTALAALAMVLIGLSTVQPILGYSKDWTPPMRQYYTYDVDSRATATEGEMIDVDGDHLVDFVRSWKAASGTRYTDTYLNMGNGWKKVSNQDSTSAEGKVYKLSRTLAPLPEVLTVPEQSGFLRLDNVQTLLDLIDEHAITAHRFGDELHVTKAELQRYMAVVPRGDRPATADPDVVRFLHAAGCLHLTTRFADQCCS